MLLAHKGASKFQSNIAYAIARGYCKCTGGLWWRLDILNIWAWQDFWNNQKGRHIVSLYSVSLLAWTDSIMNRCIAVILPLLPICYCYCLCCGHLTLKIMQAMTQRPLWIPCLLWLCSMNYRPIFSLILQNIRGCSYSEIRCSNKYSNVKRYTVSSYLSLVTEALACVSYLSAHNDR